MFSGTLSLQPLSQMVFAVKNVWNTDIGVICVKVKENIYIDHHA